MKMKKRRKAQQKKSATEEKHQIRNKSHGGRTRVVEQSCVGFDSPDSLETSQKEVSATLRQKQPPLARGYLQPLVIARIGRR